MAKKITIEIEFEGFEEDLTIENIIKNISNAFKNNKQDKESEPKIRKQYPVFRNNKIYKEIIKRLMKRGDIVSSELTDLFEIGDKTKSIKVAAAYLRRLYRIFPELITREKLGISHYQIYYLTEKGKKISFEKWCELLEIKKCEIPEGYKKIGDSV